MPSTNHFKFGASGISSATRGGFKVGVSGGADYGPTSTTGFWNGITPPVGGYTIYVDKASQGPSIHVASDDAQCIGMLLAMGATGSTISDVLAWANGQSNMAVLSAELTVGDLPGGGGGSGIYAGGFNAKQFTLYSPSSPLTTGSILYTDLGHTIPFNQTNFSVANYNFQLAYPSGSIQYIFPNIQGNTMPIPVKQTADLGGFPNYTAFAYPTPCDSLTQAYNSNLPVYSTLDSSSTYLSYFTGWSTISDGVYIFDYDDTTGLLSNPTLSSVVNGYSSFKYRIGPVDACEAGNNARSGKLATSYYSGSVIENGITLYSDTSLTTPASINTFISDGFYTYAVDISGVVSLKTPYANNFYITNTALYNGSSCQFDSGSTTLYFNSIYGSPYENYEDITSYYTDLCFTAPYTASGVFLNSSYGIYSVTGGSLTYIGACDAITGSVGLSNIDSADACTNSSTAPISVYAIGISPFTLSDTANYNAAVYYTSDNNPITASYISNGVTSYSVIQNFSGSATSVVVNPPTSC